MPQNADKLRKAKNVKDDEFYTSYTCAEYVLSLCVKALPKRTLMILGADTDASNFVKYCINTGIDSIWDIDIMKLPEQLIAEKMADDMGHVGHYYQAMCLVTNPPFSKLKDIMPMVHEMCNKYKDFYFCLIMPVYDVNTRYMNPFLKDVDLHVYRLPIKYQTFFQKSTGMYQKQGFNVLCTNIPNLAPLTMPTRKTYDFSQPELLESCYSLNFMEYFKLHGYKVTEFRVDPLLANQYVKVRWTKIKENI